jgi:hypothetical protein
VFYIEFSTEFYADSAAAFAPFFAEFTTVSLAEFAALPIFFSNYLLILNCAFATVPTAAIPICCKSSIVMPWASGVKPNSIKISYKSYIPFTNLARLSILSFWHNCVNSLISSIASLINIK